METSETDSVKSSVCVRCGIPLGEGDRLLLSCGHVFHLSCMRHVAHAQQYVGCSVCMPTSTESGVLHSDQTKIPDFGDDTRSEKLRTFNHSMADLAQSYSCLKVQEIGSLLRTKEYRDRSNAIRLQPGAVQKMSALTRKMYNRFLEYDELEGDLRLGLETDPVVMVHRQMKASDMIKHHVDMESIVRKGITMENLLHRGYSMQDFIVLRMTWRDLVALQLTPELWNAYRKELPIRDLQQLYDITIHDIYGLCQQSIIRLCRMGLSVDEHVYLKSNATTLCSFGMTKEDMIACCFSMEAWARKMDLSFAQLNDPLQLTSEDLGTSGLQWISTDNWHADTEKFKQLFGRAPDNLSNTPGVHTW